MPTNNAINSMVELYAGVPSSTRAQGVLIYDSTNNNLYASAGSGTWYLVGGASGDLQSLNGLTAAVQYFATGTTGSDFNISSVTDTHTFNIPDAGASARGLVTTAAQTLAGTKTVQVIFPAGTATAGTAPAKFTSGTNLTSPETGAEEFDGTLLYFTPSATRGTLAWTSGTTYTKGDLLAATSTTALGKLGVGTNGQVLTAASGQSTGLQWATPAYQVFPWTDVTGTTQAAAVNNGYISDNAGLVTITLPATAAIGDTVKITGKAAGGWLLAQNSGQTVYFGNQNTTAGTGGSLASSNQRDGVEVVCITANTTWNVLGSIGNITIV